MLKKVLVANRGEIACRVIRTLRKMGIGSVAVYSEADRDAPHVSLADEAFLLGPPQVASSYLNQERIMVAAHISGADAVHPGYGLLSENAAFASLCEENHITFIGPSPDQILTFGLKHSAREKALQCGVTLLPGSGLLEDIDDALRHARVIGYPVMLKSTAGGGGIGMRRCDDAGELAGAFASVARQGAASFGDAGVFIEKFIVHARHIEVQIFGDGEGNVIAMGERDCSTQRRNQKIIEETPAPNLDERTRTELHTAAIALGRSVNYRSAGTVEFVLDADTGAFYFLEVNTRLQVEHTVTEEVTGLDLVEWMVRLAGGKNPGVRGNDVPRSGHSMQVRIYAEDPNKDFQPSCGLLTHVKLPDAARCDGWIAAGTEVTPYYDPLLVKIITRGDTREECLQHMTAALDDTAIAGIETNLSYLRQVTGSEIFRSGGITTRSLASFPYAPRTVDVLSPGTQSTLQDYPGRVGYWEVGVPPSGAMDPLSLRLANRLLANADSAAALEMTVSGPTLRFNAPTWACLTGAHMPATLNGNPIGYFRPFKIEAGDTLQIGVTAGPGCRAYLAVCGGFDVPPCLGSRSTFTLGNMGGHAGRALRVGDVLPISAIGEASVIDLDCAAIAPEIAHVWNIGVLYGPHGMPEFFTGGDMETFFSSEWEVHYNSARTGVRLIGPKPEWARADGGEAGLHPSNIHDNAYAVGSVDFTGDMPILLGPDGPSLGGFVCPAVVVQAELWKLGQLRPGDKVRFRRLCEHEARQLEQHQEAALLTLDGPLTLPIQPTPPAHVPQSSAIMRRVNAHGDCPDFVYRPSGDRNLLIEVGPPTLDIRLRFWVHAVHCGLQERAHPAILDLTPGIRSLQVHFDSRRISMDDVIGLAEEVRRSLPAMDEIEVPSRIIHLPLSWDDPATQEAIARYTQSVRPDAPWCPSNIEFIRRINGLDSIKDVKRIVFDASYLVLGLGDVYLGAPVATPIDPRHRLVTTKYNPARTWTPENAVGIGGAYLCIYGMEGPGGYQFVGRTIQMWNRYRVTDSFEAGKPWLLRFFDQVRFYPVTAEQLLELRHDFPQGRFMPRVENTVFRLSEHLQFLARESDGIAAFRSRQRRAFEEERLRWAELGIDAQSPAADDDTESNGASGEMDAGHEAVQSPVSGSVWKLLVSAGDSIDAGQTVALVEAMKMEIQVHSPSRGRVAQILCREGQGVSPGQALLAVDVTA